LFCNVYEDLKKKIPRTSNKDLESVSAELKNIILRMLKIRKNVDKEIGLYPCQKTPGF
jgi:hypothetical protein